MPQSQPEVPEVATSSVLSLGELDAAQPAKFALVHAGPKGPTSGDPAIQLVFSQPLRKLGPDTPVPDGIVVTPETAGHWQWVGAFGLTFVPDGGRLRRATRYQVRLPRTLTSLSGEPLDEASEFSFSTPTARVLRSSPASYGASSKPDTPLVLWFSEPVSAAKVAPFVYAKVDGEPQALRTTQGLTPKELVVRSVSGWPLASTIDFGVQPGFPTEEGPVPAQKGYTSSFKTYGPFIASVICERDALRHCRPEGGLSLSLSNPVAARKLSRAIRGQGTKLLVDQDWGARATTRHISLGGKLKPRREFKVVVDPILDIYGQPLAFVRDRQVAVADYRPNVRIGFSGDAVPLSEPRVAVLSTNVAYELVTAALTAQELVALSRLKSTDRFEHVRGLASAKKQRVAMGPLNRRKRHLIALDRLTKNGPFAVGVSFQVSGELKQAVRWGQRSDLGLSVKSGRERSLAWVTDLTTGRPVSGAELRVVGSTRSVLSDAEGVATLPPGDFVSRADKSGPAQWLSVTHAGQSAYRASDDPVDPWRLSAETDFYGEPEDVAFLFPERDVFRPGERAWVKAYVRRPSQAGNQMVIGENLSLSLLSPDGEAVHTRKVTTNRFGAVAARLPIPAAGKLGYWNAQLKRGKKVLASAHLQVAEFRRSEFSVDVRPSVNELVTGESVGWNVKGSYFYGGVMAGAQLQTLLRRVPTSFTPKGLSDYVVGDAAFQYHEPYRHFSPTLDSGKHKLDKLGELGSSSNIVLPLQTGPERIEFEATVTDLSAQTATARGSVLAHPASHYIAIKRPETNLIDVPGVLRPQIRTVTPEGARVSGRSVSLALYRLRWTHVKRASGRNSSETVTELVKDLVSSCRLVSGSTDRSCELSVRASGQHVLRARSSDPEGRETFSSTSFYAVGGEGVAAWRDFDARRTVELSPDRETYSPGQTARILIKSPFRKARAWITVEKNGVISQRIERVSGSTPTVRVPVDESMRPNAYVGVHLIEDRQALGAKAHSIGESYRLGYTELRIDPERQRLSVSARATKQEYRPGQTVELAVEVKDAKGRGRASEVTVFVVDEGVLTLSGYKLPDPLNVFTRPQPLRVETSESRESIARLFGLEPNQNDKKGDPGGGGGNERSAMLTTAYFNPGIETDAEGKARVKFKLPDNLGRFRVMALGVTEDDRYGKGQSGFNVNRPLMVRPALPRFLRAGDELELSAVVSNLGLKSGEVRVEVGAAELSLLEPASKALRLESDASALVSFKAKATQTGPVKIRFAVSSKNERDSVVLKKAVQSPAQLEAVALYGKTQSAEGHQLGTLDAVRKDLGGLDVTLSSSALVGLKGGFEQLWDYPYQCSEQLSSRVFPLLLLRDLAAATGVAMPPDHKARVSRNLAQLVRRQRGDGGFGMWPESGRSAPYVSAYALWVLHVAAERGASISASTFERGARYLQDVASKREEAALANATFAAFVLSRIGRGDKNTLSALYEHVDRIPFESQMVLLWTAASLEMDAIAEPLLRRAEASVTLRGNKAEIAAPRAEQQGLSMGSAMRRHAITLNALLAARPAHALAAPLVRGLLAARAGGGWQNTQESAYALLSLDSYRRAQEKIEPKFNALVFLGEKLLGQEAFAGRSVQSKEFSVPMQGLLSGGNLVFQREGAGTLFFEARLKYARVRLPTAPLESGFMVQKTMTPLGENWREAPIVPLDRDSAGHGGLVLVDLTVLAPTARRFVVIDDPLPAGLEALDMSLNNAQGSLSSLLSQPDGGYGQAWHRTELRDDRVLTFVDDMPPGVYKYRYLARATTRGKFVTPPTRAMEMYQEEVYGRTAARSFEVQ